MNVNQHWDQLQSQEPQRYARELMLAYKSTTDELVKEETFRRLLDAHTGLVRTVVHGLFDWYLRGDDPFLEADDLLSYGMLGLARAIERFNPSLCYAFTTFAVPRIRGTIRNSIIEYGATIRIPAHVYEQRGAAYKRGEAMPVPTATLSLDDPISDDATTFLEFAVDPTAHLFPIEEQENAALRDALLPALGTLTVRQREVVNLIVVQGMEFSAAARQLGLSRSRVYQLLDKARFALKRQLASQAEADELFAIEGFSDPVPAPVADFWWDGSVKARRWTPRSQGMTS